MTCTDDITMHYWFVLWLFDIWQAGAIIGIYEIFRWLWRLTKYWD